MGAAETGKAEVGKGRRKAQHELSKPAAALLFVLSYAVFAAGRIAFRVDRAWYERLAKPVWTLPEVAIEVVWLAMFGVLAYTTVLVFRKAGGTLIAHLVFATRVVHWIALQALVVFLFALKDLRLTAYDSVVLFAVAAVVAVTAHRVSRRAALLLGVYCAWLAYTASVAWGMWLMNR